MLRIILGIDISTTCTGVSIASYDGKDVKILYVDKVKFRNRKDVKGTDALFMKSRQFLNEFITPHKEYAISDVVIEEPLPNSQNRLTVDTLLKFNGMISQLIYDNFGVVPQYISSYDARKYAFPELMAVRRFSKSGIEYPMNKVLKSIAKDELVLFGDYQIDCQKKYILWNKVSEMFPDIEWEYNRKDELKTENFDASDSLVCILGYVNKERYCMTSPKVVCCSTEKLDVNGMTVDRVEYSTEFCGKTSKKTLDFVSQELI